MNQQQAKAPKISSTQIVLEAARDLHDLDQEVTRESLQAATGLQLYIVDERVRVLINEGTMIRLERGKYAPAETFREPRPMSKTILASGMVKYEIGDQLLELTPHEDRAFAELTAGALVKLVGIEGNRQAGIVNARNQERLDALEKSSRSRDWPSRTNKQKAGT